MSYTEPFKILDFLLMHCTFNGINMVYYIRQLVDIQRIVVAESQRSVSLPSRLRSPGSARICQRLPVQRHRPQCRSESHPSGSKNNCIYNKPCLPFRSVISSKWDTPKSKTGYRIFPGNKLILQNTLSSFLNLILVLMTYLELNLISKTLHTETY